MKKNNLSKFTKFTIKDASATKGGSVDWASIAETASKFTGGGAYFFGYGNSTGDYSDGGSCRYWFGDGRSITGDCP